MLIVKMLKMTISTSVWSVQHPNTGQNIQQYLHQNSSKHCNKCHLQLSIFNLLLIGITKLRQSQEQIENHLCMQNLVLTLLANPFIDISFLLLGALDRLDSLLWGDLVQRPSLSSLRLQPLLQDHVDQRTQQQVPHHFP